MTAEPEVELSDEAVVVRSLRASDAFLLYGAVRESLGELGRWLSWCTPDYSLETATGFLKAQRDARVNDSEYALAIIDRKTGQFAGGIGINQVEKAALRANLGYWLRTASTGRGLATHAVRLVARWRLRTWASSASRSSPPPAITPASAWPSARALRAKRSRVAGCASTACSTTPWSSRSCGAISLR